MHNTPRSHYAGYGALLAITLGGFMLTILAAVLVFGILVTVHEFGHFITAKLTGMRVDEFAIGFGPKLYQQKDGDTLYSLRMIPLGGYNKIAGMDR